LNRPRLGCQPVQPAGATTADWEPPNAMRIVERYILRKISVMFWAGLIGVVIIAWTAQVVSQINVVTDNGDSIAAFFHISLYTLPNVVPVVVPFAFALATTHVLNTLNQDSELIVVNASGASRFIVLRPLLVYGVIAAAVVFGFNAFVEPPAAQQRRLLIAESRSDLISTLIQEGTFRKIDTDVFMQIGSRESNGTLGRIFVSDSREQDVDLIYYAKRGNLQKRGDAPVLILEDGEVQRRSKDRSVSIIKFTSYAFDLSEFVAAAETIQYAPRDRSTSYLMNPDPDDYYVRKLPLAIKVELSARFTNWLYPIVFSLVAFAVAGDARSHRQARFNPLVTGTIVALILRWGGYVLQSQAEKQEVLIVGLYALPLGAMLILSLMIWRSIPLEPPAGVVDALIERAERVYASAAKRFNLPSSPAGGAA
jgi:lipopolysaccharide export system permease protein